jgi:hypothetical protein
LDAFGSGSSFARRRSSSKPRASSAGIGFPKYQPCPIAQPSRITVAYAASVSMPSMQTGTDTAPATVVTARTIAALSRLVLILLTKLRSILMMSKGSD